MATTISHTLRCVVRAAERIQALACDAAKGLLDATRTIVPSSQNFASASSEAPALFAGEDLRDAVLRLKAAGMSYTLISAALGVSKGKVAGIVYRAANPDAGKLYMRKYHKTNYTPRTGAAAVDASRGRASSAVRQPALPVSAAPQGPVRTIIVVGALPLHEGCRWPMWPHATRPAFGDHQFCDAVRFDRRHVYCERHAARAFKREGVVA